MVSWIGPKWSNSDNNGAIELIRETISSPVESTGIKNKKLILSLLAKYHYIAAHFRGDR